MKVQINTKAIVEVVKNNLFYLISIVLFIITALFVQNVEAVSLVQESEKIPTVYDTEIDYENTDNSEPQEDIEQPSFYTYKAKENDSFWNISENYYGSGIYYEAIMAYNGYSSDAALKIGDELILPSIEDEDFIEIFKTLEEQRAIEKEEFGNSTQMIMKAGTNPNGYKFGERQNPAVDITVPDITDIMKNYTGKVDTSSFKHLGKYTTTGYTPGCEHCCGNTKGIGASGVPVICGYSVAAPKNIPLGTTLYIEGYGFYVVEDRGAFGNHNIDIACPSHESCGKVTDTSGNINVYIVPNN